MKRLAVLACSLPLTFALAACSASKSSNPLSPTLAGPIPGVEITPPKLLEPLANQKIAVDQQPLTLLFENSASNGPRPLYYTIEVATDANFTTKVFSRANVAQGTGGRTSLRLPDPLAPERSYYWRVRAEDGANTGPFTAAGHFDVYTPIIIGQPVPVQPINNVTVDSLRPTFIFTNAPHSGPLGPISYVVQVSLTPDFGQVFTIGPVPEGPGQTSVQSPQDGNWSTYYYWRVRAQDPTNAGPWSNPTAFSTPAQPAPPPSGGGGGGGGDGQSCGSHPGPGPLTTDRARQVVLGTSCEYPALTQVFSSDSAASAASTELLLRMIWHLQLAGFQAGRQQNPSGAISGDKLTILIDGVWHAYDVMSLGYAGRATTVQFVEVSPPHYIPDGGIPD